MPLSNILNTASASIVASTMQAGWSSFFLPVERSGHFNESTDNLDSVDSVRIIEMLIELQAKHGMTFIVVINENEIANAAAKDIRFRDGQIERERIAP
jgi:hypothetical protein